MIFVHNTPTNRLLNMVLGAMAGGKTVEDTATGNPLTFITDKAKPLKSLLIPFTPQQEGTGDPSPQNIRSILPWNGLTVFGGGKNLLNPVADDWLICENTYRYINGVVPKGATARFTLEVKDSTVDISGCYLGFVLNDLAESSPTGYKWVIEGGTVKTDMSNLSTGGSQVGQRCSNVFIYPATVETFQKLFSRFDVMVELGQTATAYEPYKPITETDISFPSPVYGGTLDVVSGVLTVEWICYDLSDFTWEEYATNRVRSDYLTDKPIVFPEGANDYPQVVAEKYIPLRQSSSLATYQNGLIIMPHSASPTGRVLAYFDGENYPSGKACFKLATPQTVTLTPAQITALVGDNTIWSDADGQMTATYLKKG